MSNPLFLLQYVIFTDKTNSMKRRVLIYAIFIFFCTAFFSFGEDFLTPFVSRLKAVPKGNTIVLTWMDSKDPISSYFVYRNTKRITDATFPSSVKIGIVPPGKELFVDTPGKTIPYFYAVLAAGPEKTPYKLFIPYRNITDQPVQITNTASPESLSTVITGIRTTILDKKIKIIFRSSKPDREVIIYRSTSPLQEKEDLTHATAIATIPSSRGYYLDSPVPDISYYYGVFDEKLTRSGKYIFKRGENVTKNSTELPLTSEYLPERNSLSSLREQPLPFLDLRIGIESGKPLQATTLSLPPPYRPLQKKTVKVLSALIKNIPQYIPPVPSASIFPSDKTAKENSENYQLVRILKTDFSSGNW